MADTANDAILKLAKSIVEQVRASGLTVAQRSAAYDIAHQLIQAEEAAAAAKA